MLLLALVGTAAGGAIPSFIADSDARLAALFNAGNFTGVQDLYMPGGALVPPTCDTLIPSSMAAEVFKNMSAAGVPTIKLTPLEAYPDSNVTVYHEIGEATSPGNVSLGFYYVRWQQNDDGVWQIAADAIMLAEANPAPLQVSEPAQPAPELPSWLKVLWPAAVAAYNRGDMITYLGFFNDGASGPAGQYNTSLYQWLNSKADLQAYLTPIFAQKVQISPFVGVMGVQTYNDAPIAAYMTGDGAWWVISTWASAFPTSPDISGHSLTRFADVDGVWQIVFQVEMLGAVAIGAVVIQ